MISKRREARRHRQLVSDVLGNNHSDEFDDKELHDFEADAMLDPAEVVDKEGDIVDCFHSQGKVQKEILRVGQGVDKPKMGALCRIKYIAYFYDKEIFDNRAQIQPVDIYLGDVKLAEGLWRGIMEMRLGEKAKIKIKKKFAYGRPGEVDKLDFPPEFVSGERRQKLLTKNVIYEVELLQFVQRLDIEGFGKIFKQIETKPDKYDH